MTPGLGRHAIALAGVQGGNRGYSSAFGEAAVDIAKRLREFREAKGLSQGDIPEQSGLTRSYISRVQYDLQCLLAALVRQGRRIGVHI